MITRRRRLERARRRWCRTTSTSYWQMHARIPEDRARALAAHPRRARRDRAGRAARRADRGGSRAAQARRRRPGDRRRLDRLDAVDREAARDHRAACRTAPWCCRASTPISTSRPGRRSAATTGHRTRRPAIRNSRCRRLLRRTRHRRATRSRSSAPPLAHGREALRRRPCGRPRRPIAGATRSRQRHSTSTAAALASMSLIEAANAEDEALAIAVALRETLTETPGKTAALITPDRALARRVRRRAGALERAGRRFRRRSACRHAGRRCSRGSRPRRRSSGCEPVTLLALLKHPLLPARRRRERALAAIAALERAILRGPRPTRRQRRACSTRLQTLRAHARRTCTAAIRADAVTDASSIAPPTLIAHAGKPRSRRWNACERKPRRSPRSRRAIATRSPRSRAIARAKRRFRGRDGTALRERVRGHRRQRHGAALRGRAARLCRTVPRARSPSAWCAGPARRRARAHLRPAGSAPAAGRPRRARRAGRRRLAAGDAQRSLAQPADAAANSGSICRSGASACRRMTSRRRSARREVILTRAAKRRRRADRGLALRAAARRGRRRGALGRGAGARRTLSRLGARARPAGRVEAARSARRRGRRVAARPKRLSVTEIEHWLRDPYTIYAKHILRLQPLDPVDTPPGARDRGTVIHEAIGDFTAHFADGLPADPLRELLALGREAFRTARRLSGGAARSGGRASSASRAGSSDWETRAPARRRGPSTPRSRRQTIPHGATDFHAARARRPHRAAQRRHAIAILDYKTGAAAAPKAGAQSASRRSSRWKPRSCATAASRACRPAARSPNSLYVRLQRRRSGRRAERASTSRTARPTRRPTRRLTRLTRDWSRSSTTTTSPIVSLVASDVDRTHLRRLRPSRARQGMVGDRRRRRGRCRMSARAASPTAVASTPQLDASDPAVSAWVSANAGSGKTHVLAQRVIKLLLRGVDPAKILCITFTKAAAANMANRVFDTLAGLDRARRRRARRGDPRASACNARRNAARARAAAVRRWRWRRRAG